MENDKTMAPDRENKEKEQLHRKFEGDVVDLGQYWANLRPNLWKIALLSLAAGVAMLLYMFTKPNIYQSTAVITPSVDEDKQTPALGALASFGVSIGGPSSIEDLESLFKSNDLTVRVARKYNIWGFILADKFDPATGKIKPNWMNRLFSNEKGLKPPGDWDAIRASKNYLKVTANKKTGTVSVSFESPSAEGSANVVKYFLDEGKSRMQEEALERATINKKFIQEQIGKTVDALTRDRLYTLYGQEVEREMMARNREQFGFRLVDSPRIPDQKSKPSRGLAALMATMVAGFAFCIYFIARDRRNQLTAYYSQGPQASANDGSGKGIVQ